MGRANVTTPGLILSRLVGERVVIGDGVTVEVIEARTRGRLPKVKLRIVAPPGVRVDREEIALRRAEGGAA